jgi:hypothetical protein
MRTIAITRKGRHLSIRVLLPKESILKRDINEPMKYTNPKNSAPAKTLASSLFPKPVSLKIEDPKYKIMLIPLNYYRR